MLNCLASVDVWAVIGGPVVLYFVYFILTLQCECFYGNVFTLYSHSMCKS